MSIDNNSRKIVFICHGTPEDNDFTLWLGTHLSTAGYEVWADILKLKGGQDWAREIENILRNKAYKMLLVATSLGVEKDGVRNEIEIATEVSRKINDDQFIIPLRLEQYEKPFRIAVTNYIDFMDGWTNGFAELLSTLNEYNVPKSNIPNENSINNWYNAYLKQSHLVKSEPEILTSNWLAISRLPDTLTYFDFPGAISHETVDKLLKEGSQPTVRFRRGFIGFGKSIDFKDIFNQVYGVEAIYEINPQTFLSNGWVELDISNFESTKIISNLLRQSWNNFMRLRGLIPYGYSGNSIGWWLPKGFVSSDKISFDFGDNLKGWRNLVGRNNVKKVNWHFGVTGKPWMKPNQCFRLIPRIIFTDDKGFPVDKERMHKLRRSCTRSWRNKKWRDMLLAFIYWLAGGDNKIIIPVVPETNISLAVPPIQMISPISVITQEDETYYDDEDEYDMEFFDIEID